MLAPHATAQDLRDALQRSAGAGLRRSTRVCLAWGQSNDMNHTAVTGPTRGSLHDQIPYPQAIYVTMFPCCECAKLLIQAGIREVVFFEDKALPARPASAPLSTIR